MGVTTVYPEHRKGLRFPRARTDNSAAPRAIKGVQRYVWGTLKVFSAGVLQTVYGHKYLAYYKLPSFLQSHAPADIQEKGVMCLP